MRHSGCEAAWEVNFGVIMQKDDMEEAGLHTHILQRYPNQSCVHRGSLVSMGRRGPVPLRDRPKPPVVPTMAWHSVALRSHLLLVTAFSGGGSDVGI